MSGRRSVYSNPIRQSYAGRRERGEVQHRNAVVRVGKDRLVHRKQKGNVSTTRKLNAIETREFVLDIIGGADGDTDT